MYIYIYIYIYICIYIIYAIIKIMRPTGYHHNGFVVTQLMHLCTWCTTVYLFSPLHIYYAHLTFVRFEHSVCCGSLKWPNEENNCTISFLLNIYYISFISYVSCILFILYIYILCILYIICILYIYIYIYIYR